MQGECFHHISLVGKSGIRDLKPSLLFFTKDYHHSGHYRQTALGFLNSVDPLDTVSVI